MFCSSACKTKLKKERWLIDKKKIFHETNYTKDINFLQIHQLVFYCYGYC